MILNRLVIPEGNNIRFCLEHKEDGKAYQLKDGEKYYFRVRINSPDGNSIYECTSETNYFDAVNMLSFGTYAFEVGIQEAGTHKNRIILPAFDDRLMPLNEIVILRRIIMNE